MISFSHVILESNKAVDLLENAGMEGALGFRCNILEAFGEEEWAQHCRHLATRDVDRETQMDCPIDGRTCGDRRHEHAYTRPDKCCAVTLV